MISPDQDYQAIADAEAEKTAFLWMQAIDATEKHSYAEKGLTCLAVRDRLLWRYRTDPDTGLPCRSFTRWMRIAAPWGYSTAFAALHDVEELADVPPVDLAKIPASNFPTMRQLSTAVRADREVIEAAKTQRSEDFVETIRQKHPDQHLEHKKTLRFHPAESAAQKIEEALKMAEEHGASTREEALELLAVTSVDQWRLESEVEDSIRGAEHSHE